MKRPIKYVIIDPLYDKIEANEGSFQMRKCWPIVAVASCVGVLLIVCLGTLLNDKDPSPTPFSNTAELSSAIRHLPVIGVENQPSPFDWKAYVNLARRIRISRADIVKGALSSTDPAESDDFYFEIKRMILLRVCFECPKDQAPTYFHGNWQWASERTSVDMNWPVGTRGHILFLQDRAAGYMGRDYNAVEEFEWRTNHCKWRDW